MEIIHPFGGKTQRFTTQFAGRELTIETGKLAFMADGAVTVRYGDTVVMATATTSSEPREGIDFFPLMVDYEERMYAAGKISGSRFVKREGRPSEQAILTSRLIDRPIRPLFPKGYRNDVQVVVVVLSADLEHTPDIISIIAASSALMLSGAPFDGPVGACRIGMVEDELIAYPSAEQLVNSKLSLTVAGTKDAIMMVEAEANEVAEDVIIKALDLAKEAWQPVIKLQEEMAAAVGVKVQKFDLHMPEGEIVEKVAKVLEGKLGDGVRHKDAKLRNESLGELRQHAIDQLAFLEDNPTDEANEGRYPKAEVKAAFGKVIDMEIRRAILEDGARPDGRATTEIRPISGDTGLLPRTHGSALFTRGSTQALSVVTLGPASDAQLIDTMEEDTKKRYMHHYNFPPYSTGEAKPMRSAGRREIGHGYLAEKALLAVLPDHEEFPYTIRVVSEILSSNGSTSMASVCGSTLSLMDAGVPIRKPVAGIAMGLVLDHDKPGTYIVLSDIQGTEDFAGDMDFKVAGTSEGITALQMDIKVKGITVEIMKNALAQAHEGREHIMGKLLEILDAPRPELSPYAPRITKLNINPEKIREVIGKGGEMINRIIDETGVEIDIDDTGLVMIASNDESAAKAAKEWIESLVAEPEVGRVYKGKVVRVMDFGAFMEIMPGKDGLLHISQISDERVEDINTVLKEGDEFDVKLVEIDSMGRLNLSKKVIGRD
jgi:polyribonucleotide nucleotidyltransferase